MRHASGDNFTIDIEDGIGVVRVFRRTDLDHQALARCAQQLLAHGRALTLKGGIAGLVLDLRRVPGAAAPEVERAYAELASAWEQTGQRIAFLLLDDRVQAMQISRVVSENAARFGAVLSDRNEARNFAGATGASQPNTMSRLLDRPSRVKKT